MAVGKRAATFGAAGVHLLHGASRIAGDLVDIVGIALDIYSVVVAFREGDGLTQGIAVSNLILSTVGTGAAFVGLFGPSLFSASIVAASGPVGIAAFALAIIGAVIAKVSDVSTCGTYLRI